MVARGTANAYEALSGSCVANGHDPIHVRGCNTTAVERIRHAPNIALSLEFFRSQALFTSNQIIEHNIVAAAYSDNLAVRGKSCADSFSKGMKRPSLVRARCRFPCHGHLRNALFNTILPVSVR